MGAHKTPSPLHEVSLFCLKLRAIGVVIVSNHSQLPSFSLIQLRTISWHIIMSHYAGRVRRVSSGWASYVATGCDPGVHGAKGCRWHLYSGGLGHAHALAAPERSLKGFPSLSSSASLLRGARLTVVQHITSDRLDPEPSPQPLVTRTRALFVSLVCLGRSADT
jgi:hypothetical protein